MKRLNLSQAMNIVNSNGIILFTTENCGVCKIVKNMLKDQQKIHFYQTMPDELIAKRVKLKSVPTCIKFQNGKPVKHLVGLNTKNAYLELAQLEPCKHPNKIIKVIESVTVCETTVLVCKDCNEILSKPQIDC